MLTDIQADQINKAAEREHLSWKLVDRDAEDFKVVVAERDSTMFRHYAEACRFCVCFVS